MWKDRIPSQGSHPLGSVDHLHWQILLREGLPKDDSVSDATKRLSYLLKNGGSVITVFQPLFKTPLHRPPPEGDWKFKLLLASRTPLDVEFRGVFSQLLAQGDLDFVGTWSADRAPESADAKFVKAWLGAEGRDSTWWDGY